MAGELESVLVGDLHGRVGRLERFIERFGEDAHYLFLGDFFDRGQEYPDGGYRIVRRVMGLPNARALVGNHEALMLSAIREEEHGPDPAAQKRGWPSARACWERNGGRPAEREAILADRKAQEWLMSLPAMTRLDHTLIQHADTENYLQFGDDMEEINVNLNQELRNDPWRVFANLTDRRNFVDRPEGAHAWVKRFGAERLVHAHTPHWLDRPFEYHDGLCVDIDGKFQEGGAVMTIAAVS